MISQSKSSRLIAPELVVTTGVAGGPATATPTANVPIANRIVDLFMWFPSVEPERAGVGLRRVVAIAVDAGGTAVVGRIGDQQRLAEVGESHAGVGAQPGGRVVGLEHAAQLRRGVADVVDVGRAGPVLRRLRRR